MNGLGVELLVYIYLAVCVSMILFNIGTIIVAKKRYKYNAKKRDQYESIIRRELTDIRDGKQPDKRHIKYMKRNLYLQEHLLVFVQVMTELFKEFPDEMPTYLDALSPAMLALTERYDRHSDPITYAFFLYSLRVFQQMSGKTPPEVEDILLGALREDSTYCRENALKAIYSSGETELVIRALDVLNSENINHNKKLLTDGLLTFKGDKNELNERLWERFESFDVGMQVVILDYIRFCAKSNDEKILSILKDEKRSPELRFSCIRYFGKYPSDEAYPILIEMVENPDELRWEYPAISCTALASYPGEKTVATLKKALRVSNWYVRYNAAESLSRLGLGYVDLIDVIDGNDRYAREILQFQLDVKYNQKKEAEAR